LCTNFIWSLPRPENRSPVQGDSVRAGDGHAPAPTVLNHRRRTGPNDGQRDFVHFKNLFRTDQGAVDATGRSLLRQSRLIPWRLTLERVRGKVDFFDGLERNSSQTLLNLLEVPQRTELGWSAVRVRDLTRGGYKEQVRGYCREAQRAMG
jgi:hypothetical protein